MLAFYLKKTSIPSGETRAYPATRRFFLIKIPPIV
nr:MAG TPA: hypothetical protein [Caudoviricetes sp.]